MKGRPHVGNSKWPLRLSAKIIAGKIENGYEYNENIFEKYPILIEYTICFIKRNEHDIFFQKKSLVKILLLVRDIDNIMVT